MEKEKREYEKSTLGHEWIKDENGNVDIWQHEAVQYCNGPKCKKCGYSFCHHCNKMPNISCEDELKEQRNNT